MKESRELEFKRDVTNTFLKTVSAFANYGDGAILFGVDDEGEPVGINDARDACLAIENKINDSIFPNPDYALDADSKTNVITLSVKQGIHQPYLYKSKAYKRNDTATIEVSRVELSRLVLEGQNLSYDSLPSRMGQPAEFEVLGERLREQLGLSQVTDDSLKSLELKSPDGALTVAGELLSDRNTFPGVDLVRFGESINVFLDREIHEHISLLEQYDKAVSLFKKYYQYEVVEGMTRVPKSLIPESAFREAIANALVHRQWDVSTSIRVSMHPDRIEISSPGGLPKGISEEEYLWGQVSILRNPIIGNVFFRLHLIERFGTGIPRIRDAYKDSVRKPSFTVFENSVLTVLPVLEKGENLSVDERAVLKVVVGKSLSSGDVAAKTGFGKSKAHKLLKELCQRGYVSMSGTGRGTRYTA